MIFIKTNAVSTDTYPIQFNPIQFNPIQFNPIQFNLLLIVMYSVIDGNFPLACPFAVPSICR